MNKNFFLEISFFNVKNIARTKLHIFLVIVGNFCSILSLGFLIIALMRERERFRKFDVCNCS
uniref:Uncharacterized protein n=1 Tax=Helianthus annuus TaxID=4232 RepID=A0A251UVM8_HELAN